MDDPPPQLFFEVFESLPRQGPGNRPSTAKALAHCGDLPSRPRIADLVWSEGAIYNVGLGAALATSLDLLRPGGYFVFTDAVWRTDDVAPEVRAAFSDAPTMGKVSDALDAIERSGFELVEHFTLPEEAWWDDFYKPMLRRIERLRTRHAGDDETLAALDELAAEPEMHRKYGDSYAYEFFVVRKPAVVDLESTR
ncbi:MAG: hypothetical protein AAF726_21595 [Planctomycetota bacterium]